MDDDKIGREWVPGSEDDYLEDRRGKDEYGLNPYPGFVLLYEDGVIAHTDEQTISRMYDLADCDAMEGIKAVFSVDQTGNLIAIRIGKSKKINQDQEYPFRYAQSPVYAGMRIVGYITHTDH